jgi:hypothetical protein
MIYALLLFPSSAWAMEGKLPTHNILVPDDGIEWGQEKKKTKLAFSSNGKLLAGCHSLKNGKSLLTVWNPNVTSITKLSALSLSQEIDNFIPSNDGKSIYSANTREVALWDVETQRAKGAIHIGLCNDGHVCFAERPQKQTLAIAAGCACKGSVSFLDLRTGEEEIVLSLKKLGGILSIAYSRDGEQFAVMAEDAAGGACIRTLESEHFATIKLYDQEALPNPRSENLSGMVVAFDDKNALHYGYAYSHRNPILLSKNLSTGEYSQSLGLPAPIKSFAFHPGSFCSYNGETMETITMWEPKPLSTVALSIVQRAKSNFLNNPLAKEAKEFNELPTDERLWIKDHLMHLGRCALENLGHQN